MALDVYLEQHFPTVVCQCLPPCLLPILNADGSLAETSGCLLRKDHEGPHGLDGTTEFTYREQMIGIGPRVVLRQEQPGGLYRGTCFRCHAEYALSLVGLLAETVAAVRADGA